MRSTMQDGPPSDRASYEWVPRPWWQRWLLRLVAVAALAGVAYGVVTIVRSGTEGKSSGAPGLTPQLTRLATSQKALAGRLEALRPGRSPKQALAALRAVRRDQVAAVGGLRRRQAGGARLAEERRVQDALGAEFDYLDAVGSVLRNRGGPLLKSLGKRAETAKAAFTALEDSARVEDGIHGTTALTQWAQARR